MMARFLHGKLEKLNMFERNLTPRSEMFAFSIFKMLGLVLNKYKYSIN